MNYFDNYHNVYVIINVYVIEKLKVDTKALTAGN